jgi:ribosomal protein S18 acetylase RimI-like enzyme
LADVTLREFRFPDDYSLVCELWEQAGPGIHVRQSDEPAEIQKKLLRDPDLFLVAELGDTLVGTVIGGFDGRRGMIYHLAVRADLRNQGIGMALLQEVERRLHDRGCLKSYLLVTTDNQDALRFYFRHGWETMDQVHILGKDL